MNYLPFVAGLAAGPVLRTLVVRGALLKLGRDVRALNAGDHRPLLAGYAPDAVLRFNEGDHRWSGDHHGRDAIERFLREFVEAGVQGEIKDLWIGGPPWALRMVARFDDWAVDEQGERIYANRTCLVVRTRWGRIVEHEDFYEDTNRILTFEQALRDRGRTPVSTS